MRAFGVLIAWICLITAGCGSRNGSGEELVFPKLIVAPRCNEAPLRVEASRVELDQTRRKPSPDIENYIVDLRVQAQGPQDLWLLVNHESFPSRVREVRRDTNGIWWFSGNEVVAARSLGRVSDISLLGLQVQTPRSSVPVVIGTISVEDMSAKDWVKRGGAADQRSTSAQALVPSDFEVACATWLELRPVTTAPDDSRAKP
jgi:hypothetical protein